MATAFRVKNHIDPNGYRNTYDVVRAFIVVQNGRILPRISIKKKIESQFCIIMILLSLGYIFFFIIVVRANLYYF